MIDYLTSGQVCELAEIQAHVFNDWCVKGIVEPALGGEGQGDHRRFGLMQAVGIVAAAQVRRSHQGCVLGYVKTVVQAFADFSEAKLLSLFDEGRTHLALVHNGKPLLQGKAQGPTYDWPDVQAIYHTVKAQRPQLVVNQRAKK